MGEHGERARSEAERWPSIGSEQQEWVSRSGTWGTRAAEDPFGGRSYRSAVPPFIAKLDIPLSKHTASLAEDATAELIRFDSALGGEVAPFATLLLRSESSASSRIENLTASARAVFTAELDDSERARPRRNADTIVANTRAMEAALRLADRLTISTVLGMHRELMLGDPHHDSGEFRDEAVWIGSSSISPLDAEFVGPAHARILPLMDDLMTFAVRDDLPKFAQSVVAHAQFETIHPFTDGNGRTGRALLQAMLRGKGVTRNVTVPVSGGLLTDTAGYHHALTAYRAGDVDTVVTLASESAFRAVENASILVADIRDIRSGWNETVTARRGAGVWTALDVVARQPVLNASTLAKSLGIEPSNAYRVLDRLVDAGVLVKQHEYGQGMLWRSVVLLDALDAFAERAGRRR